MTHCQPPYQSGIGQESQGIFLCRPFGAMILPFQRMIGLSDGRGSFLYFL
nr:hypothetical protein [uncultured Megasphaera sp.]